MLTPLKTLLRRARDVAAMSEDIKKDDTGASVASASVIGQQAFTSPAGPPPAYEDRELPPGWVKQFDRKASLV